MDVEAQYSHLHHQTFVRAVVLETTVQQEDNDIET